jgi:protein O-mannosyl-transferase
MADQLQNLYRNPPVQPKEPRPTESLPARRTWLYRELPLTLALAALVLVAYWGVWNFDFTYFDDPGYVTENLDVIKGLPLLKYPAVFRDNVYWAFTAFVQSNWHPLTWLSHMLDVQLYGLNPGGHHVTNIIFHTGNVLLLFWLLRWTTKRTFASAVVAALFAVHPMHVESVVWVAERKDVLSTFLALCTLLTYVAYARRTQFSRDWQVLAGILAGVTWIFVLLCLTAFHDGHPEKLQVAFLWTYPLLLGGAAVYAGAFGRWNLLVYCAVFVLFALGLLAKPMLITLPCICLLLDFWPLNRLRRSEALPVREVIERTAGPRRRAKRNQRLRPVQRAVSVESRPGTSLLKQIMLLVFEKLPLFGLSAISAIITPYAQNHGGSMASATDLSFAFRLENAIQSYMTYITRLFWPGKMSVLYLLDIDHVNHVYTAAAVAILLLITALAVGGLYFGRRYLLFGWLWYVGSLVPVIGIIQVGEQTHADRYTYIPYIGLFIMLVWSVADWIDWLSSRQSGTAADTASMAASADDLLPRSLHGKQVLQLAAGCLIAAVLPICVGWTKYQLQFWTEVEVHLRHALTITPDNWNMLNNLGVRLWKNAQEQDKLATEADSKGDAAAAEAFRKRAKELKDDAKAQWLHGISSRPTATDIHSNLGYAYSEAASQSQDAANQLQATAVQLEKTNREASNRKLEESKLKQEESKHFLDRAEFHLGEAVRLKEISPRPHNNLGRVLLRRSQQYEAEANAAEAKAKTDPAEAAKVAALRQLQKSKLDQAIAQFEKAVELDPTLLEARLNLGEVYTQMKRFDKAAEHYHKILDLNSESVVDPDAKANFSQAHFGLARIALAQDNPDEAIAAMKQALLINPNNMAAIQRLTPELFLRGKYREATQILRLWFSKLPPKDRMKVAQSFGIQFEQSGKHEAAVRAWDCAAWILATAPEQQLRDPRAALELADGVVRVTKQQDPLALDTLAAALAATGQFAPAIQAAQAAVSLANSQGNKPLAEIITQRLQSYRRSTPYIGDANGSDRP